APNGVTFAAPSSSWQFSATAPTSTNFDVTQDGVVNYADAAEVALEWKTSREQGQPCGLSNDLTRDANGDGCIDVSDIQFVLANAGGTFPKASAPGSEPSSDTGSSATTATVDSTAVTANSAVVTAPSLTFIVNSTTDAADANVGN